MANQMSEYVIKLGTQIDNAGVNQILKALDSSKLKALGLTAALSTLSTAIYKFAQSAAKQELELEKLAKAQHKTTAAVNAQNTALKSMGMTLKDINKDKELKKVYDDIKKFNEEMQLPGINETLGKIKDLRAAFWKLKDALNFATQSIGRQFLINMQRPIEKLTGGMNDISKWVQNNLNSISAKVSSVLTAFSKGVFGIGEGVTTIFDRINKLPDSIKQVGVALAGIFAFANMGTLGRLLTVITLIGDIIHDKDVYQWNKDHGLNPGDKDYVGNLNDKFGIWDMIFGGGDVRETSKLLTGQILEGINDALTNFVSSLDSANIGGWFDEEGGFIAKIFGGIGDYLVSEEGASQLGTLLNNLLDTALSIEGFTGRLGRDVIGKLGKMIGVAFGSEDFLKGVNDAFGEDNTVATGVVNGFITAILTNGNVFASLVTGLSTIYKNALLEAGEQGEGESNEDYWYRVLGIATNDLKDFGQGIFEMVAGALSSASDLSGSLLSAIANAVIGAIAGSDEGSISKALQDAISGLGETDLFGAFGVALGTTLATGNFGIGLVSGIATYFSDLSQKVGTGEGQYSDIWEALKADASEFWSKIEDIWYGPVEQLSDGSTGRNSKKGLGSLFSKLWEGDSDFGGLKSMFEKIGAQIGEWLEPVKSAVQSFFANLWVDIFNNIPGWMKTIFGLKNPNTSTASEDTNTGEISVTSTTGGNKTYKKGEITDNAVAVLDSLGGYYTLDKNGKISMTNGGEELYTISNAGSGNSLGIGRAQVRAQEILQYIIDNGRLPGEGNDKGATVGSAGPWKRWGVDYDNASDLLKDLGFENGKGKALLDVLPNVDTSTIQSQIDSGNYHVNASVNVEEKKAWGGRIGRRMDGVTVGEDGTEYIIPITKPERAASLIQQMFGEMGNSAVSRIMGGMGLGQPGTNGASLGSLQTAMGGMAMSNTYNINAPVNINVNSSGADAKEIGSSIYDMAERHLIKNVMGVYA